MSQHVSTGNMLYYHPIQPYLSTALHMHFENTAETALCQKSMIHLHCSKVCYHNYHSSIIFNLSIMFFQVLFDINKIITQKQYQSHCLGYVCNRDVDFGHPTCNGASLSKFYYWNSSTEDCMPYQFYSCPNLGVTKPHLNSQAYQTRIECLNECGCEF